MFTYRSKITLGLKIHLPKPANRTRSIRHSHWLATTAVLAFAFAAALVVYSIAPATNDREVRAQDGNAASTDVTVIPPPPVETPYDADRTAPSPNDGRRTIVAPPYPDYPNGSITGVGSVALDWDDVPTALSYAVQVHTGTAWTLLPWNDVTIQFSGTSAQIDGLPNYDTYYLRLRAENTAGNSPWSGFAVIVNDVTNQATSTPAATATQEPAPTATQEPAPTATQEPAPTATQEPAPTATEVPDPNATDTPTPTATTTATDFEVLANLIAQTVQDVYADSSFTTKETAFLNCMQRENDSRPDSFDDVLDEYIGSTKTAVDTCDAETGIFQMFHELSKSKLDAIINPPLAPSSAADTRTTLITSSYGTILNGSYGTSFKMNINTPDVVKDFARIRSERAAGMPAARSGGSEPGVDEDYTIQDTFDCIPDPDDELPTDPDVDLARKLEVLNCVVLKSPWSFWSWERNALMVVHSRGWLWSNPDNDHCSKSFDGPEPACFRHDFAFETLQKVVESENDGLDIDAAWNPRNKYLADLVMRRDIERNGCLAIQDENWLFSTVRHMGCVGTNGFTAGLYTWATNKFNSKGWVITPAEVRHAENLRQYTECMPPTIDDIEWSNDQNNQWKIYADWPDHSNCHGTVNIKKHKIQWKFEGTDGGSSQPRNETDSMTRAEITVPTIRQFDLQFVSFNAASVEPTEIEHGRWLFRAGIYPVPGSFLADEVFDTTVFIRNFDTIPDTKNDEREFVAGTEVLMRVDVQTTRSTGDYSHSWRRKSGSGFQILTSGTSGNEARYTRTSAGMETFKVIVTHQKPFTGIPGESREPFVVNSREITITWTPAPEPTNTPTPEPTNTSTPTAVPTVEASGSITVSDNNPTVGDRVLFTGNFNIPEDSDVYVDYPSNFSQNRCSGSAAGDSDTGQRGFGQTWKRLYACLSGTVEVHLMEDRVNGNDRSLGSVSVTIDPTPSSADIDVEDTSIRVGEFTDVEIDYVLGSDATSIEITWDSDLSENSYCSPRGGSDTVTSSSGTLDYTFFGCMAATGTIGVREIPNGDLLDSANITISTPVPTATPVPPTPTHTPVPPTPTNTPVPTAIPSTGSLVARPATIKVGEETEVTSEWDLPVGYSSRLSYTSEVSINCSNRSAADNLTRSDHSGTYVYTLEGCSAGRARVQLLRMPDREPLATIYIQVDVPEPTNLRHGHGANWLNFVWDAPSGYSDFKAKFDSRAEETISRTTYFVNGLDEGTAYRFGVKTLADDERTSGEVSLYVETDCDLECFRSRQNRQAAAPREFGDGIHRVGTEIIAGTYVIGAQAEGQTCEWARLIRLDGTEGQVVEQGTWMENSSVVLGEGDAAFYTSGCGVWKLKE